MPLGELILIGPVSDISVREGVSQKPGKPARPWKMTTAFISGRRNTFRVLLTDDQAADINVGDDVALTVYPDVFEGKVGGYRSTGYWSGETAPARSSAA